MNFQALSRGNGNSILAWKTSGRWPGRTRLPLCLQQPGSRSREEQHLPLWMSTGWGENISVSLSYIISEAHDVWILLEYRQREAEKCIKMIEVGFSNNCWKCGMGHPCIDFGTEECDAFCILVPRRSLSECVGCQDPRLMWLDPGDICTDVPISYMSKLLGLCVNFLSHLSSPTSSSLL